MPSLRRPVFLTGLMGSGKSTVGRALADVCGAGFVDLDGRVERLYGESIPQVFARSESEFRARESDALHSLLAEPAFARQAVVVATGGGTVVDLRNRESMLGVGDVVFVDVTVDELAARLAQAGQRDTRPLLAAASATPEPDPDLAVCERLGELRRERSEAYRDRALIVDGLGSPTEVAERILAALDAGRQSGETRPRHQAV